MTWVNDKPAKDWIEENHPNNGVFRVYWKDVITTNRGGATLNPDEGEGLRYEWEYKDGKRVDGISKGWWPNGNIKIIRNDVETVEQLQHGSNSWGSPFNFKVVKK